MSDKINNNPGLQPVNDDELDTVAGGLGGDYNPYEGQNYKRCPYGKRDVRQSCKGCVELTCKETAGRCFTYTCTFFKISWEEFYIGNIW